METWQCRFCPLESVTRVSHRPVGKLYFRAETIVEASWEEASFQNVLNMLYVDILSREQDISTTVKE